MEFEHAKLISDLMKDYEHLIDLLKEIKDGHNFSLMYHTPDGITRSRQLGEREILIFAEMAKKEADTILNKIYKFDESKIPYIPPFDI